MNPTATVCVVSLVLSCPRCAALHCSPPPEPLCWRQRARPDALRRTAARPVESRDANASGRAPRATHTGKGDHPPLLQLLQLQQKQPQPPQQQHISPVPHRLPSSFFLVNRPWDVVPLAGCATCSTCRPHLPLSLELPFPSPLAVCYLLIHEPYLAGAGDLVGAACQPWLAASS